MCCFCSILQFPVIFSFNALPWFDASNASDASKASHALAQAFWRKGSAICMLCLKGFIHMCDSTRSFVWHDTFICVTCLIDTCDMYRSRVWLCVGCVCDMCVWRVCVTCVCDMSDIHVAKPQGIHLYVWHYFFIRVIRLICMCDMPHW